MAATDAQSMRPRPFARSLALPPQRFGALRALLSVVSSIGLLGQVPVVAQEVSAQDSLPKGPGRDIVLSTCGVCHEIDTAIGMRRRGCAAAVHRPIAESSSARNPDARAAYAGR